MRVAAGAVGVLGVLSAALAVHERMNGSDGFEALVRSEQPATIDCAGSVVELAFDPEAGIDARVRGITVASADAARRGLNHTDCKETPAHRGWDTRLPYKVVATSTTLVCRFPGRFFVQVNAVAPSWAGERPAGSAVGLVLAKRVGPGSGPNRTMVASATVLERVDESEVVFAPRYCTPS
jgi:hypothetical protein